LIVVDTNLLVYFWIQGPRTSIAEAVQYNVISHRILALAARSRCSAYDCEFVVLAQELGVPLVTTDAQVLQAFPTVALRPEIFAAS